MDNDGQGIRETFVPGVTEGDIYRYIVESAPKEPGDIAPLA